VTFDKGSTPEQREAINAWIGKVFPIQWGSVEVGEDEISWSDDEKTAHASLASGLAEIHLDKVLDPRGEQAVVMNTPYWASNSNTGFRLAHSTHHYDVDPSYRFEKRNGFVITINVQGELSD
ncbi:MAG: hypothetical protein V3T81_08710, partial [Thermoanaerobaculia bacterium]